MQINQERMKNNLDRKLKEEQFQIEDLVLKWDSPKEDKHGKFDHMRVGPYIIVAYIGNNAFIL